MVQDNDLTTSNSIYKEYANSEDLEMKDFIGLLIRNKNLVSIFTLLGLFISLSIALTARKTWQGSFQVVLGNSPEVARNTGMNSTAAKLVGLGKSVNKLKTEVEILKSPSVLMEIFEFIKGEKSSQEIRFTSWRDSSLKIELQNGTSILNLAYKDQDKDLVLPVLNRISKAYQSYSGRRRLRKLQLGIDYFKDQIEIYKQKSIESRRKAQEFGIEQDLSILNNESGIDKDITNSINIEEIRINAANKIRLIDQQLKQLKRLKNGSDEIIYLASTITGKENDKLIDELKSIDLSISKLRKKYRENDRTIKDLLRARETIIQVLNSQIIVFLNAEKLNAISKLNASERPEGVLIKYKQLISDSKKDKSTLDNLENQYRVILLEQARNEDPWELITTPTLLPYPIAPRKKQIVLIGLFSGIFLGLIASFISDKKKDTIFSIREMQYLSKLPLLLELPNQEKDIMDENIELFFNSSIFSNNESFAFLKVGKINDKRLDLINTKINEFESSSKFIFTNKAREASRYKNIIILASLGVSKKKDLISLCKKLSLQTANKLGLFVLN